MLDVCKTLGIEKIVEDPVYYDLLKQKILNKTRYVIPGYACDYYLHTFPGEIEFTLCRGTDDSDLGVAMHFSSNSMLSLELDRVVENKGVTHIYLLRSPHEKESFPVRIVCPDILACPQNADVIHGQLVAFADKVIASGQEDSGMYIRDNGSGTVRLSGKIEHISEFDFEFQDVQAHFWELITETSIGTFETVVLKDKLPEPQRGDYLCVEAILSMDVALQPEIYSQMPYVEHPYQNTPLGEGNRLGPGFVPNMKNAEKVLQECIENQNFSRFIRACAPTVTISVNTVEQIVDYGNIAAELSRIIPEHISECKMMHIISCSNQRILGWNAFAMKVGEGTVCVLVISINSDGFVDEIFAVDPESCELGYDSELHALAMLEYARCSCKNVMLKEYLTDNCIYRSEYADRMTIGCKRIIDRLDSVAGNLNETNQYSFEIVPAEKVLRSKTDLPLAYQGKWCSVEHQGGKLAAVMLIQTADNGLISNMLFSCSGKYLTLFENDDNSEESSQPSTENVRKLLSDFYGTSDTIEVMRDNDTPDETEGNIYVWKQADAFIRPWLQNNGYAVHETEIEEDCIGYACARKEIEYAVFVYAYGKKKTAFLDGEYCQCLKDYAISANRKILIIYLRVDVTENENGKKEYRVGRFGDPKDPPEIWTLGNVDGKNILLFYPRPEIYNMIFRLMAAYNTQNLDLLEAICTENVGLDYLDGGRALNAGFYSFLSNNYSKHGKMKTAYVRYNDVVFSTVPYLENYCFLTFSVTNDTDRICNIEEKPLDGSFKELLITDEQIHECELNEYPLLRNISAFPPSDIARFSMRLEFENGEIRRFNFKTTDEAAPKSDDDSDDSASVNEIERIGGFCITDKIFRNGRIEEHIELPQWPGYRNYPQRGQGVSFVNGYAISTAYLYFNSYPIEEFCYSNLADVHVSQFDYCDDGYGVGYIHNLDPANPRYLLNKNTMIAKTIPSQYQNTQIMIYPFCGGYSEGRLMVNSTGRIDLRYHHNREGCAGMWGWLDTDFNIVIPAQYIFAMNFEGGRAIVCKGEWQEFNEGIHTQYWCEHEKWGVIDLNGDEVVPCAFDELYEVEGSNELYFVHENGWDNGHYAIFDVKSQNIILKLDFDFDIGYMFNECFVTDNNILCFVDHQPGEGRDFLYAYDLSERKYLAYKEEHTERTFNGEKRAVAHRDGKEIIIF